MIDSVVDLRVLALTVLGNDLDVRGVRSRVHQVQLVFSIVQAVWSENIVTPVCGPIFGSRIVNSAPVITKIALIVEVFAFEDPRQPTLLPKRIKLAVGVDGNRGTFGGFIASGV